MDDQPTPRRSLFAVWHWPQWTWGVVVVLIPVAYLLSAPPLAVLSYRITPGFFSWLLHCYTYPAELCVVHCHAYSYLWEWAASAMERMID